MGRRVEKATPTEEIQQAGGNEGTYVKPSPPLSP